MRRIAAPAGVVLAFLLLSACARANPVPSFEEQMYPFYWLIKTLPFNYAVDLIALCLALLVFRQNEAIAWRLVPLYNLMVVTAGYISDWAAREISAYPPYFPTTRDPLVRGFVTSGGYGDPYRNDFTFIAGASFMAAAALLIYLFSLATIWYVLRLNDVESQGRLPFAAAIVPVLTSPYIALQEAAKAAWFVPVILVLLWLAALVLAKHLLRRGKRKRQDSNSRCC